MDKKYISCLVNDKVGVCAISLVLDKRHVRNGGKVVSNGSKILI